MSISLTPRRSWIARWSSTIAICIIALATSVALLGKEAHAAKYAAMVVDGHTGKILYSRNGDALRYPASLTKIMTLYLLFDAMEEGKLNGKSRLTVSKFASRQSPSKLGLKPGQTIRVEDAIKALVTKSANDVAVVVAENLAGSEENFARLMTEKARSIGMRKTVFKNASGLPNKHQVTTARDMITMANRLMFDHPEKYENFSRKYFKYKGRNYRNHNRLLFTYKGTDGIKTGYTRASGFNLLANVRRKNKHLIAVVFGGKTGAKRNAAMKSILNRSMPKAIAQLPRKKRPNREKVQFASAAAFPSSAARKAIKNIPPRPALVGQPGSSAAMAPATVAALPRQTAQTTRQASSAGDFHIQVGAYARKSDAMERLETIRLKAGDVIRGHTPLAIPLEERQLFRARFAGFTRSTAKNTCHQLKRRAITCVVMAAE